MQMSILQKALAHIQHRRQGRFAMRRALTGGALIIAFSCALVLSVSPQLHERIHRDAQKSHHECAVTLIAAGNYHHAVAAPFVSAPVLAVQFSHIATLNPIWVQSPFLGACVFEHAPPAQA
jgi:hypothetical protein